MTDYRTLLADAVHGILGCDYDLASDVAGHALDTRIPDPRPDSDGHGRIHIGNGESAGTIACDHPNAPTIADLLQWGENVAKARVVKGHMDHRSGCVHVGDYCHDADDVGLLAALRGEGQ